MYKLCKTKDTVIDPIAAVCPVGARSDSSKRFADICIYAEGIPNARVYLNSKVLREALLSNPELVKEILELEVEQCHCHKNDEKKLQKHLEKLEKDPDGVVNEPEYPEAKPGDIKVLVNGKQILHEEAVEEAPKKKKKSKAAPTEGETGW